MWEDDPDRQKFEDMIRSIAQEVSEQVERTIGQVDMEEIAGRIGVDADRAREWVDTATFWMRAQFEHFGDDVMSRASGQPASDVPDGPAPAPDSMPAGRADDPRGSDRTDATSDPLRNAAPHPLDLPTDEQGLALAALDSGRWTIEPGSSALELRGEGSGPSDALGLVRELRARDWIGLDGAITLAGGRALNRWLDAATR